MLNYMTVSLQSLKYSLSNIQNKISHVNKAIYHIIIKNEQIVNEICNTKSIM